MNCRRIDKYMPEYCVGALADGLRDEVTEHISKCSRCRANYRFTLLENEVLRDSFVPPLAETFTARVMQNTCLAEEVAPEPAVAAAPPVQRRWAKYAAVLVAAAAALIILPRVLPSISTDFAKPEAKPQIIVADDVTGSADLDPVEEMAALVETPEEEPAAAPVAQPEAPAPVMLASTDESAGSSYPAAFTKYLSDASADSLARPGGDSSRAVRPEGDALAAAPVPAALPAYYQLAEVSSANAYAVGYYYVNTKDNSELYIEISPADTVFNSNRKTALPTVAAVNDDDAAAATAVAPEEAAGEAGPPAAPEDLVSAYADADAGEASAGGSGSVNAESGEAPADAPEPSPAAEQNTAAPLPAHSAIAESETFNMIEIEYYGSDGVYNVCLQSNGSLAEVMALASNFSLIAAP